MHVFPSMLRIHQYLLPIPIKLNLDAIMSFFPLYEPPPLLKFY